MPASCFRGNLEETADECHCAARHPSSTRDETRDYLRRGPRAWRSPTPPAASSRATVGRNWKKPGRLHGQELGPRSRWQKECCPAQFAAHAGKAAGTAKQRTSAHCSPEAVLRGRPHQKGARATRHRGDREDRGLAPGGAQRLALGNPGSSASTGWTLRGFAPRCTAFPGDQPDPVRGHSWGPEAQLTAAAQELRGTRPVTVTQAGWAGSGYAGVSRASARGTTPTTTTAPAPRWPSTGSSDHRAH